jgi:hypothetical protein
VLEAAGSRDDPEAEQIEVWVELVELSQDPDFRAGMRRMAEQHAAERAQSDTTLVRRDAAATVRDQVGPALNGWPAAESIAPALDWFIQALRARVPA